MAKRGYERFQPIIMRDEGQAIIDGHTRLRTAIGIDKVPVHYKSIATEDEEVPFAFSGKLGKITFDLGESGVTREAIIKMMEELAKKRDR